MGFVTKLVTLIAALALSTSAFAQGAQVIQQNLRVLGKIQVDREFIATPQSTTCADNGGGTPAACTLTVTRSTVLYTCSDTHGCTMTMSEVGANPGQVVRIVNMGANVLTFADSAGVQELPASISLAITETVEFTYATSAWVQSGVIALATVSGDLTVSGGDITGANSESLNIGSTDATFKLIRNTAGVVTLTAADDDATAALTMTPGGAAALILGSTSATGVTLQSDTAGVKVGTTANTVLLNRATAGTVTLTAADDDATAALTVLPGGAAAMVLGGASMTSLTVTTDSTGTAEVALPAGSIDTTELLDATLLPADEAYPGRGSFTICGDAVTIADATPIYYGPSNVVVAGYGRTCDITQAGNATEATADQPAFTAKAFQVRGMVCLLDDPGAVGTPITLTLRSAAADLTPSVTCAIADNESNCVAAQQTTTAVASAATVAIKAVGSGDVATARFHCTVDISF